MTIECQCLDSATVYVRPESMEVGDDSSTESEDTMYPKTTFSIVVVEMSEQVETATVKMVWADDVKIIILWFFL